jgi:hypothetical protein
LTSLSSSGLAKPPEAWLIPFKKQPIVFPHFDFSQSLKLLYHVILSSTLTLP